MFLEHIIGFFSNDIGIDLGTANTLVFLRGRGIVLAEPSIIAIDKLNKKIIAVGKEAKDMIGKTPDTIEVIRPLKDGVIADFDTTQAMLQYFIKKVHSNMFLTKILKPRPRVVVGVPSGITTVEKRAVIDAARQAGAREVYLIAEPMAAAIGAGLPIDVPGGNMIVDIGGGTSEIAVISLSGIVVSNSIRIAGDEMTEAIINYLKRNNHILIGEQTAENIKITLGSAYPSERDEKTMEIRGRDMTGMPRSITITGREIREALEDVISSIINAVKTTLERTPPELAADIVERGIVLAGGGSLIYKLDQRLRDETNLPVVYCDEPLTAVARGIGKALNNIELIKRVSMK
ncbi:rod shape-determining protein [Venenivibrio stagnispumantis]|uniref:Cell shape-determining protein MreB n=1 Tax=Venenivibrio stagnispumantis TaxID=407998 RepID=A0AA45WKL5_9AQUI|nr:rod shape-determining protein [Venenivibrio stagnispumantis]MCW4573047.1 rod shape-determining protein [Venenivibrio stagnispumantis]SMP07304.1 rod shape-determining protein MreB [Venenivibrio stagnispumantis]